MKNKKSENYTVLNRIKSVLANHDLSGIQYGFLIDLKDRKMADKIRLTTPASTWTTMMDLLAHYWGYADNSIYKDTDFSDKFTSFLSAAAKKSSIVVEIIKAYENKIAQDKFFENNPRIYSIHDGHVKIMNHKTEGPIDFSSNSLNLFYKKASFKHCEHYLSVENESIETLKEASKIIGEKWSFMLIVDSIDYSFEGRDLGKIPTLRIGTAKMDGEYLYDQETALVQIGLPLTMDRFFRVADELASSSNEVYHSPQLQHIKRMLASHFMKEELDKTLPSKEANQPVIKRVAVKI
jgi:hypothetical protein